MASRWLIEQTYEDLLLIHWPVAPDALAGLLPPGLTPALFDGTAWVGRDVYLATHVHLAGPLSLPSLPSAPEVTLRAIVDHAGEGRGLFLLDLAVDSRAEAWVGRELIGVRSEAAIVEFWRPHADRIRVRCARERRGQMVIEYGPRPARGEGASGSAGPEPATAPGRLGTAAGDLDTFLLGGDRLFVARAHEPPHVIATRHGPWTLVPADARIEEDSLAILPPAPGEGRVVASYQRRQQAWLALSGGAGRSG